MGKSTANKSQQDETMEIEEKTEENPIPAVAAAAPTTDKEEYEALCQLVNPIAQPMASRKLAKKIYKLVKKSAKEKGNLRHGLADVMKAIRKKEKGIVILAGFNYNSIKYNNF